MVKVVVNGLTPNILICIGCGGEKIQGIKASDGDEWFNKCLNCGREWKEDDNSIFDDIERNLPPHMAIVLDNLLSKD